MVSRATAALSLISLASCVFDGTGVNRPLPDAGRSDRAVVDSADREAAVDTTTTDSKPDSPGSPDWWNTAWAGRIRLTFDNSERAEDLEPFVALVVLDPSRLDTSALRQGQDLRFVDEDHSTVLSHEIDSWTPGGTSHIWVKVPQIRGQSVDDHIWLYYDNLTVEASDAPAEAVWSGFAGVWHLSDLLDSAGDFDLTNHGSTVADGMISTGRSFAEPAYLELPQDNALDLEEPTVELVFRTTQSWDETYWPASATLITRATSGTGSTDWSIVGGRREDESGNAGRVIVGVGNNPSDVHVCSSGGPLNDGEFHYVVWTRTISNGTGTSRIYIDGIESVTMNDNGSSIVGVRPIQIGGDKFHDGGSYLDGVIDEVRISSTPRSPGWIAAQHASLTDSFISYGQPERR